LSALVFFYAALLPVPLYANFPALPGKVRYLAARHALARVGVALALTHAMYAVFAVYGGLGNLDFISQGEGLAVSLGLGVLIIALVAALGNTQWMLQLNRWFYVAGFLLLIHFNLLGSDFNNLSAAIPMVSLILTAVLILLEARRWYKQNMPSYKIATLVLVFGLLYYLIITHHLKHFFGLHVH